ncbi:hypothetical protein F4777DRAFT_163271 [Nemania sp. FL0916]|nr:hypothetical protein F4777DRAFT_163271 [Nemania sp. FL0916]
MLGDAMPAKRKHSPSRDHDRDGNAADDASTLTSISTSTSTSTSSLPSIRHKRRRHTLAPDLLSPLSDELLVRILSLLPLHDLLNLALVSNRFYRLSGDSQVWKRLYYSRFVLPRALRLPGFRNGSARDGKLHYSSHRTLWPEGRKTGADRHTPDGESGSGHHGWKRLYKLRHNWARGQCVVQELPLNRDSGVGDTSEPPKLLVKVLEGVAVTADVVAGLRVWDLKTKRLMAQADLDDGEDCVAPSCMALDGQLLPQRSLDIAVGLADGSFSIWRLHLEQERIVRRYRHEGSSNGELISMAFLHPYLLTATKSTLISLYAFGSISPARRKNNGRATENEKESETGIDGKTSLELRTTSSTEHGLFEEHVLNKRQDTKMGRSKPDLPAPRLLTSLRSHTSRAPLALSLRKMAGNTAASIAYTFSTIRGWSLGIQELHIRPDHSTLSSWPEVTTTQLASTLPVNGPPRDPSELSQSPRGRVSSVGIPASELDRPTRSSEPTSLSYTHPYLLATLPDNTLILHLCTSGSSSLSISPGIRLWGHTSGISDAEITARGKAVSVSCRGEEIRVWELEGRTSGQSIEVRPTAKRTAKGAVLESKLLGDERIQWDDQRNWVGFDDEMVIVLKEAGDGRESLLVYDFT